MVDENHQYLTYPALTYLSCRKDTAADVLATLDNSILFWFERSDLSRNSQIARPLIRRLQQDDDLLRLMIAKLQDHPTTTEKVTYLQLIDHARGTAAIKDWCLEEFERQQNGAMPPEIGMDATEGEFVPVAHIILNAINGAHP